MNMINAIGRRWATVLAGVLIGVVLAILFSVIQPRDYSATVRMYVTAGTSDLAEAYQGGIAAQNAVHSFAVLATDPGVASRAIASSGVPISVDQLVANTTASSPPQTVILDVSVKADSADDAGKLANAVARDLISVVDKLEGPTAGGPGALRLVVVDPNTQGAVKAQLVNPLLLLIGAALGGVVGVAVAAGLEGRAVRRRERGELSDGADETEPLDPKTVAVTRVVAGDLVYDTEQVSDVDPRGEAAYSAELLKDAEPADDDASVAR